MNVEFIDGAADINDTVAGSFGEHSINNAQEKQNLAEAITVSQAPQHSHSAGFEVPCLGLQSLRP